MGRFFAQSSRKKKIDVEENSDELLNPTFYRGNKRIFAISIVACVISSLLTAVVFIYPCFSPKRKTLPKTERGLAEMDVMLGIAIIAMDVCLWFFSIRRHIEKEKVPSKIKINNKFIWVYIYSCLHYTGPIFVYLYTYKEQPPTLHYILSTVASFFKYFAYIYPSLHDVVDYTPYDEKSEKLVPVNASEERASKAKNLTVKESGPFKIVIQNVGTEDWNGFQVKRGRYRVTQTDKVPWFEAKFVFEEPLKPGQSVVIIPETHNEQGALKALGYRSFGPYRDKQVITTVIPLKTKGNKKPKFEVEFTETFKLPEERIPARETRFIEVRDIE